MHMQLCHASRERSFAGPGTLIKTCMKVNMFFHLSKSIRFKSRSLSFDLPYWCCEIKHANCMVMSIAWRFIPIGIIKYVPRRQYEFKRYLRRWMVRCGSPTASFRAPAPRAGLSM